MSVTVADRYSVTEDKIRFDHSAEERLYPRLFDFRHPVAYSSHLRDDKPLAATLLDEAIVVVRLDGQVRAFRDLCVHRGTALSLGWVEEGSLRCAYHGWKYGPDGMCIPPIPSFARDSSTDGANGGLPQPALPTTPDRSQSWISCKSPRKASTGGL